jgi:hypothetical protein
MPDLPHRPRTPSRNGHVARTPAAETGAPARHRCPACGAAGVRYLRSTGRWLRDDAGDVRFAYVTFCAACGHEYAPGAAS